MRGHSHQYTSLYTTHKLLLYLLSSRLRAWYSASTWNVSDWPSPVGPVWAHLVFAASSRRWPAGVLACSHPPVRANTRRADWHHLPWSWTIRERWKFIGQRMDHIHTHSLAPIKHTHTHTLTGTNQTHTHTHAYPSWRKRMCILPTTPC